MIGNIDDILVTGHTSTQPATPEHQPDIQEEVIEETEGSDYDSEPEEPREQESVDDAEFDDYGNEKAKPKTYTEDEVNERINKAVRERLARANRADNAPPTQSSQQQASGFEYNPESADNWQQQLESFVEQTVGRMSQKQAQQQQQHREQQAQAEFEDKFQRDMGKFNDFRDVVGAQPITDSMTIALRAMKDPASFIYAASKRNPQELQRISTIQDPVQQMVEMGRLEERMRKNAPSTKAPRPLSRTAEDAGMPRGEKKSSEKSIEDMIAESDKRKLAARRQRSAR